MRFKKIVIFSVLIIICLTFVLCFSALRVQPISDTDTSPVKIVLDAGHGGIDNGVSGISTGVKESELNLKIVKKLQNDFINAGFNVVLTRQSDAGLYGLATSSRKKKDMKKRKEIIESASPTLVISIHMNYFSVKSVRGAQVFYNGENEGGKLLANSIQQSFNNMEQCVKKGTAHTGDYYILNCTKYPSVICECGFLSNVEDEKLLIQDDYQNEIAYTIFKGVIDYFAVTSFNFFDNNLTCV